MDEKLNDEEIAFLNIIIPNLKFPVGKSKEMQIAENILKKINPEKPEKNKSE